MMAQLENLREQKSKDKILESTEEQTKKDML